MVALAAGLEGYFLRAATWIERGLFLAAGSLLIDPQLVTDLLGLLLLVAALAAQKLRPRTRSSRGGVVVAPSTPRSRSSRRR